MTENEAGPDRSACQRDATGTLRLTSRCARLLVSVGLMTGVLSGMFGVGGGFVIVPALVIFSGMAIHQAVGTSLFVIVLISISGVASHIAAGNELSWETTVPFMAGGFTGMWLGGMVAKRLKGPTLQKDLRDRGRSCSRFRYCQDIRFVNFKGRKHVTQILL